MRMYRLIRLKMNLNQIIFLLLLITMVMTLLLNLLAIVMLMMSHVNHPHHRPVVIFGYVCVKKKPVHVYEQEIF